MVNMKNTLIEEFSLDRRRRLHDLVVALIRQQGDLELLEEDAPSLERGSSLESSKDPARWIDHNRRLLNRYQALIRTAVTLDALLDAEQGF